MYCTVGLNSRLAYLIGPGVRVHVLKGFHPALEAVVQRLARGDGKAERQMSGAGCTTDAHTGAVNNNSGLEHQCILAGMVWVDMLSVYEVPARGLARAPDNENAYS